MDAERSWSISEAGVRAFADATGADARLHLDRGYAAGTRYAQPIAQGMLLTDLVAGWLDEALGAAWHELETTYRAPVPVGSVLSVRVTDGEPPGSYVLHGRVGDRQVLVGHVTVAGGTPGVTQSIAGGS